MLEKSCQIGNRISGAGEILCSQLANSADNLELLFTAVSDVIMTGLTLQVTFHIKITHGHSTEANE